MPAYLLIHDRVETLLKKSVVCCTRLTPIQSKLSVFIKIKSSHCFYFTSWLSLLLAGPACLTLLCFPAQRGRPRRSVWQFWNISSNRSDWMPGMTAGIIVWRKRSAGIVDVVSDCYLARLSILDTELKLTPAWVAFFSRSFL